ncbi:TPA: hypothetical protein VMA91_001022 [Streptococcus pyogenes]|uniref:phage tail assembly chaperone G n=1 Tax=Streptococcus pyogenes TaxID=1314 RepID=UPI0006A58014|nr:hypothetical protein [Streptococcus pyogenes]HER4572499.1 hypothetical protein [Streptococcus pyogenes NGAS641]HER4629956.1 hypothetical protein [Streptococcus pyogenes NGAS599]HER4701303.1 hypothetical protein [Streptococcus pyogenes NGAS322]AKZ50476.1 hypothetical protein SD89_05030 [Streptococcus pyogenes]HEP1234095.1 hypothetical protein [Streptococcus pyogenes]
MYEITLKKGGVDKEFKKDFINVEDNLLAVEHQVRQSAVFSDEKRRLDSKAHRKLNESYLQMFVDMYAGQFTVDDLKQSDMSVLNTLNDLYIAALGGEEEEGETEKKEQ